MKKNEVFSYLFTFLILFVLTGCLGRSHNLRKISSVNTVDEQEQLELPTSVELEFVDGAKTVIIGNYFDISNRDSRDDSPGFIQEGNWFQDTMTGSGGSVTRYSKDPGARAIYTTDLLGDSTYCIWIYRVASPDATKNLIVDIYDGTEQIGLGSIDLSLVANRSGWYPFGEYTFSNGQESKVILSKGFEDEALLKVDEVRFERLEENYDCYGKTYADLSDEKVVFAKGLDEKTFRAVEGYREYGVWENSTLKGYKGNKTRMSEDEYAYVVYNFMPRNESYCLDIYRVTTVGALSNVRVGVFQEDAEIFSTLVSFNMKPEKSGWYKLGKQSVDKDEIISVIIERDPQDIGLLLSDAVRFYRAQNCD